MLRVVESDKLTGTTAWARCHRLQGLSVGDTVRLVVTGHEQAHVYVTLQEGVVFENVLAVSPAVWSRLHTLTGSGHIEAEPMRLSVTDRLRCKAKPSWGVAVLAVLVFVAAVLGWPVTVPALLSAIAAILVAWRSHG